MFPFPSVSYKIKTAKDKLVFFHKKWLNKNVAVVIFIVFVIKYFFLTFYPSSLNQGPLNLYFYILSVF